MSPIFNDYFYKESTLYLIFINLNGIIIHFLDPISVNSWLLNWIVKYFL